MPKLTPREKETDRANRAALLAAFPKHAPGAVYAVDDLTLLIDGQWVTRRQTIMIVSFAAERERERNPRPADDRQLDFWWLA